MILENDFQHNLFQMIENETFFYEQVINVNDSDRRSKEKNMFTHYIDAVAIHNRDRGNSSSADPGDTTASTTQSTGLLTFNIKDYYAIQVNYCFHTNKALVFFLIFNLEM